MAIPGDVTERLGAPVMRQERVRAADGRSLSVARVGGKSARHSSTTFTRMRVRWSSWVLGLVILGAAGLAACRQSRERSRTVTATPSASAKQLGPARRATPARAQGKWPVGVQSVRWSPRGELLVTLHRDGVTPIRAADWSAGKTLGPGSEALVPIGVATSDATIAVGRPKAMELWTPDFARLEGRIATLGTVPLALFEGGRRVVGIQSGEAGGAILVWDTGSRKLVNRVRRGKGMHGLVVFGADGAYAATLNESVHLWKLPGWERVWSRSTGSSALRADFVAGAPRLLTSHQDGNVAEWDVPAGDRRWSACCYSDAAGAGPFLVLASADALSVLSSATHGVMSRAPRAAEAVPLQIALAPRGDFLAEVTLEGRLSIWALDASGKLKLVAGPEARRNGSTSRTEP